MRHRTGAAALAVLGALLVVVAVFMPSWWSGPIHIAGRVIHGKTVHISMLRTTGCNSGDGTCMGLDVGAGFRVIGIVTLLLATATAGVALLLAWKSWKRSLDATGFARLSLIGTAATVIGSAVFIAMVPERFEDIPAGFSPYAFFSGTAAIALAAVLALRRFAPAQEAQEPVDVRELLSTDGLRPAMLGPEPKMSRHGAVHEPQSYGAGPRFRPLYEVQAEQAQREAMMAQQQAQREAMMAQQRAGMAPSGAYPPVPPTGTYPPAPPSGPYAPAPGTGTYPPVPPMTGYSPTGNYPPISASHPAAQPYPQAMPPQAMPPQAMPPPLMPPQAMPPPLMPPQAGLPGGSYPRAGNYDAGGGVSPSAPPSSPMPSPLAVAGAAFPAQAMAPPAPLGDMLDEIDELGEDAGDLDSEDGLRRQEAEMHVLSTGTLRALSRADSTIDPPVPESSVNATSSAMLLATADQLGPDDPDELPGDAPSVTPDVVSTANLHPVTDHSKALPASDSSSWRVDPPEVAGAAPSGRADSEGDPGFDSPTTPSQMSMAAMLAQQASEAAASAGETSVELIGNRQPTEISEMDDAALEDALEAASADAASEDAAGSAGDASGLDTRAGANDSGVFLRRESAASVGRASRPPTATTSASLAALAALSKPAVITMAPSVARKSSRSAELPASAPVAAAGPIATTAPLSASSPPAGISVAAPSGATASPACPQCEAPMAWAEKHHRYYCSDCRMYF